MSKNKDGEPVVQVKGKDVKITIQERIDNLLAYAEKQILPTDKSKPDHTKAASYIKDARSAMVIAANNLSALEAKSFVLKADQLSAISALQGKEYDSYKEYLKNIFGANNPIEYLKILIQCLKITAEKIETKTALKTSNLLIKTKGPSEDLLEANRYTIEEKSKIVKQVLESIKSPSTPAEKVIELAKGLISLDGNNDDIKKALGVDYAKFFKEIGDELLAIQNPIAQTAYNEAIKLIQDNIAITKNKEEKAKLYTDIALIHFANGNDSQGVSQCKEAIKFDPRVYEQFTDSKLLLNLAKSYPPTDAYKSFIVNALSKAVTYNVKIYSLIENDAQLQGYIAKINLTICFEEYKALTEKNYDNFISWGNILKASGASKGNIDTLETSIKAYEKAIECTVSNNDKATAFLNIGLTHQETYRYYELMESKNSLYPDATVKKIASSVNIKEACEKAITLNGNIYLNINNKDVLYIISQVYFEKSLKSDGFQLSSKEVLNKLISLYPDILTYVSSVYEDSNLSEQFVSQIDLSHCYKEYAKNSNLTSENFIIFAEEFEKREDNKSAMSAYKMAYPLANEARKLDISDKFTQLGISGALANKLDNIALSSKPKEDPTISNAEALMKVLLTQNAEKEIAKIKTECTNKKALLEAQHSGQLTSAQTEYNQNVASYLKSIDDELTDLKTQYDLNIENRITSLKTETKAIHDFAIKNANNDNNAYHAIFNSKYDLLKIQHDTRTDEITAEYNSKNAEITNIKVHQLQEMQTNYDSKVQAINQTYNTQIAEANEKADCDIAQVNEKLAVHILGKEEDNSADIPPPAYSDYSTDSTDSTGITGDHGSAPDHS